MNSVQNPPAPPALVDWVDFKWLMAAQGKRVDLQRLQCDTAYAHACCQAAEHSPSDALRQCAHKLEARLEAMNEKPGNGTN